MVRGLNALWLLLVLSSCAAPPARSDFSCDRTGAGRPTYFAFMGFDGQRVALRVDGEALVDDVLPTSDEVLGLSRQVGICADGPLPTEIIIDGRTIAATVPFSRSGGTVYVSPLSTTIDLTDHRTPLLD